jgi:predicted TPR repeat methyltransferase
MAFDFFQIGLEHHRAGRLIQAETAYRNKLEEDPQNADAAHWLGVLILQSGRPAEALPFLEKAVGSRPTDSAFATNLAQAYLRCGRRDDAVATFDRAVSLDPQPIVLMGAASARIARQKPGDAEQAVELFTKARAAGLGSAELHQQLGLALLLANRVEEAVKECQIACEMQPRNAEAFHNLAAALARKGETANARLCLAQALELSPSYARACFALAVLEAEADRLIQAEALFRAAISMKPDSPAAYQALANVLAKMGQHKEALEAQQAVAMAARGQEPASHSVSDSIAQFEKRLERSPEAAKLHMLLAVKANVAPPAQLPPGSITNLFNRYANIFDDHLRGTLQYRLPEIIADVILAYYVQHPPAKPPDVLDLGCGTGICGELLRPRVATLAGADASPEMIRKARERNVYDRLEVGDLVDAMRRQPQSFDLLVAADVLIYVGDLLPAFEAAAKSLRPGGIFVFSVETGGADRFRMDMTTRRFTHSKPYLQKTAEMCGFEELRFEPVTIRFEAHQPVQGYLIVLRLQ